MKSLSGSTLRDVLRRSFGFLPAVGILAGLVLGFVLPVVDRALRIDFGIFSFTERDSARSLLETIASVTVSVAGVGFSVTIVAFTLASQQLSPRVLRTFQSDRLSQALLGAFLGTFAFCLVVLATLDAGGEALPDLSLAVAVLGAIASFALFVAFIQNAVVSLQASTLIRRMAADGQASIDRRFPAVIGADPDDPQEALRRVRERMADGDGPLSGLGVGEHLVAPDPHRAHRGEVVAAQMQEVANEPMGTPWASSAIGWGRRAFGHACSRSCRMANGATRAP